MKASFYHRNFAILKIIFIGVLGLLMLIPLSMVKNLTNERQQLQYEAQQAIAESWGGKQIIGGLTLVVPYYQPTNSRREKVKHYFHFLPSDYHISGNLDTSIRYFGIYEAPVYLADLMIAGAFDINTLNNALDGNHQYLWHDAFFVLLISDVKGIHAVSEMKINNQQFKFGPLQHKINDFIGAEAPANFMENLAQSSQKTVDFTLSLTLAGTQNIQFVPIGANSKVELTANWADPSFQGAFLPTKRQINPESFSAAWQTIELNRNFSSVWHDDVYDWYDLNSSAFGVNLYQPVDKYQQNERAIKYAFLFIVMIFVSFFLLEILFKLKLHPVQYVLIGAALSTFYLLLLALSEYLQFNWSYLIAAVAAVLIVSSYSITLLTKKSRALLIGLELSVIFAFLYMLVVSEHYSLLVGAIGVTVAVAATMYLTRHVNWYQLGSKAVNKDNEF